MKTTLTLLTVLFTLFTTQAFAEEVDAKRIMRELNQQWNTAFNAGNSTKLASLYTEHATLSPGNGEVLKGRAAIAKLFQSFIDNGAKNHQIEVIETHQDKAQIVQLSHWKAEGVNDKQEKISFGGILLSVAQKTDGQWKTVSHVWNAAQ